MLANFNSLYKLEPEAFSVWARALRACEGHDEQASSRQRGRGHAQGGGPARGAGGAECVLWFVADGPESNANLLRQAAERGLAADRIVLAQRADFDRHALARVPVIARLQFLLCLHASIVFGQHAP